MKTTSNMKMTWKMKTTPKKHGDEDNPKNEDFLDIEDNLV